MLPPYAYRVIPLPDVVLLEFEAADAKPVRPSRANGNTDRRCILDSCFWMNERRGKKFERNESKMEERCGWVADLSEGKVRYISKRRGVGC